MVNIKNAISKGVDPLCAQAVPFEALSLLPYSRTLFIVMSAIQIKVGSYVPITLQTLAVTLAGAILGPRKSFISIMIVIALTATGLPLFSGKGGLETLTGATGGFIFAFPFCALLIGFATQALFRAEFIMRNRIFSLLLYLLYLNCLVRSCLMYLGTLADACYRS